MSTGILIVSFGTTFPDARKKAIGSIEDAFAAAYPDTPVYRAFTSSIVRRRILEHEKLHIDSVDEALLRMHSDGIENVRIQSTHVIPGEEYTKLCDAARARQHMFRSVKIGKPLLWSADDFKKTIEILAQTYGFSALADREAFMLMGHGTEHAANSCYHRFQKLLFDGGYSRVLLATVEGTPAFSDTLAVIRKKGVQKITLLPFMIVAGDHVSNDLFGAGEASWKSRLAAEGCMVGGYRAGLGELPGIRALFLEHFQNADVLAC